LTTAGGSVLGAGGGGVGFDQELLLGQVDQRDAHAVRAADDAMDLDRPARVADLELMANVRNTGFLPERASASGRT
jgi:hypothetical protein